MEAFWHQFQLGGLSYIFLGNSLYQYFTALGLFLALFLAFRLFRLVAVNRLEIFAESSTIEIDNVFVRIIKGIPRGFYWFVSFYFATQYLTLPDWFRVFMERILIVVVAIQLVLGLQEFVEYFLSRHARKRGQKGEMAFHGLRLLLRMAIWTVAFLGVLSNLGFDITSLVASLGIGGIAVALAVQNILADMFSSFSIYFDKPFQVGDFIVVGDKMGTVKKVGLKTTRLAALEGEEIVISNQELTSTRIQNYKRMKERRVAHEIGLIYETSVAKLRKANEIMQKAVESTADVRFDRCHFKKFGDFSLIFELVYFVPSPEYKDFMDSQQEINFKIKSGFEKAKIEMAFPTQSIHLKK